MYRGATGYVKSYNATEAARNPPRVGLFFAHRPAVLLCRPLLVLVSARFIRDAAPVCEGVILFTLSERAPVPSLIAPIGRRTPAPLTLPASGHPRGRTVAFVCVGSMGIDILFPIVRTPSLSLSSLPLSLFRRPLQLCSLPRARCAQHCHRRRFFFGWRSAFFSIIILFRIQSIISISIVLRYFHLASHSERDETTRGGGWLVVAVPAAPPPLSPLVLGSFGLCLLPARCCHRIRSPPCSPAVCARVCARRWYNDGVAGDDSLMRLNINSHFVDASPPLFRDFFPSRDSRSRLPDEHRR